MSCSFGKNIRYTVFGESHSDQIGCVVDGIPAGEKVDMEKLCAFMKRRAPGQNEFSTPRKEDDLPIVESGLVNGETDGDSIRAIIKNNDVRSKDYEKFKKIPRPGHADYPASVRFAGQNSLAGGGIFSGRMTAPLCFAGGLLMQILERRGVEIGACIKSVSTVCDDDIDFVSGSMSELKALEAKMFPVINDEAGGRMKAEILSAKEDGDSVGGVIECVITGVPAGVGNPIFDGIENRLADAVFGIPAVRGIEFGAGFKATRMRGSEHNDPYCLDGETIKTKTNNHGGIIGGITSGMPIVFRVAFKPTPSISKEQITLNFETKKEELFSASGRHDPCIVHRAVPVVEAVAALVIGDFLLTKTENNLIATRNEINKIDDEIARLFEKRMLLANDVAEYKRKNNMAVYDPGREIRIINRVTSGMSEEIIPYAKDLYSSLFRLSRSFQYKRLASTRPFGLLGRNLSHSISPEIHNQLCDYKYSLFEKEPHELDEFFEKREFSGLNVTIPYKKDVMKYCTELSDVAKRIGSVNTITVRPDGTLYGDNSDYYGFLFMVKKSGISFKDKTVLVLGSGGSSLTVKAVAEDMGAKEIVSVSRTGAVNYENIYDYRNADIIINTTPVGMYPHNGERLIDLSRFNNLSGCLDLIYNPLLTPFLYDAKNLGVPYANGLSMLVAQAKMSAEKFINSEMPQDKIEEIVSTLSALRKNIVFIGMPGCGKSTVSALLGERLNREVVDTDALVENNEGKTIPQIFDDNGEEYFRLAETKALSEITKKSSLVIATGGGAVLREENRYFIKQNSFVVWLRRNADFLETVGRPLSKNVEELEKVRTPIYFSLADAEIEVDDNPQITLRKILKAIKGEIK